MHANFSYGLSKLIFNHPLSQVVLTFFAFTLSVSAQSISVQSKYQKGDFKLVYGGRTADILVSQDDFKVVQTAANDFASDVERVTGKGPKILHEARNASENAVIIGTLEKGSLINELVKNKKLDTSSIQSKWESFIIRTVEEPVANIKTALVIVGSDRRGTAYGVYEVSQMIGVSPWYWWADVTPDHKDNLIISQGVKHGGEPSVKYRGIFLNDEDWGLQPWAAKTFEPEVGNIGPKTYAKIFELLLRLKANTLWPAMHEVTRPFNSIPENRKVADDYAIVMGSSHAEPMLRNNVGEWKAAKENYNFITNPVGVTDYWEQRARENGKFENIYTIGMRGIHDSPIQGTKDQAERIPLLEKIFTVQRGLLAKYVNPDIDQVPQIFCPYKEVLADYRTGLRVPEDVTIVFPDDNFGYVRQFPTAEERKRKGGFGVYYHISYLGRPLSYLWLNTTPPALIWEEMSKAYENGMQRFWILNVGDIKPAEIGIEFFMQMAYDAKKWNVRNQDQFLNSWAKREFGAGFSSEIAAIMDKYYRLGYQRKPEHLQWYLPRETPRKSDLTETETLERLDGYADVQKRAEAVYAKIPALKKDSFYELVLYPVRSAALANERFFAAEIAVLYKQQNRSDAIVWARASIDADAAIERETAYFNEKLAGGKWRSMMSPEMGPGQWVGMRSTPPKLVRADFQTSGGENKNFSDRKQPPPRSSPKFLAQSGGIVSMEAENFTLQTGKNGFAWRTIVGLGKTGDSVSVFPQRAKTFDNFSIGAPSLEYHFFAAESGEFDSYFYLVPTQPLIEGNGLRFAVSIDGETPRIVTVDKDAEVSSAAWANNILNQTTVGQTKFSLKKGRHVLRIFAVDTGVVLDKIVLSSAKLPTSYFAPAETRIRQ